MSALAPRARHMVCLGSSAGGLEALRAFLRGLPTDLDCCYLIAQHVAPTRDSPLRELLARDTTLPVRVARGGMALTAGQVLVVPPDADATVDAGAVRLSARSSSPRPGPSIDTLLTSAAESWGAAAIGVVLSGTGRDGSAGTQALRAVGASTIAQQPASAGFAGMPEAAIATGAVDLILAPDDIGAALRRLTGRGRGPGRAGTDGPGKGRSVEEPADVAPPDGAGARPEPATPRDTVEQVVAAVRAATGVDFSGYKHATLRRQIGRRMAVRQIADLDAYRDAVAGSAEEARALASGVLVTVTSFYRDPDAWRALRSPLRALMAADRPPGQLRIWVPGCATGPEAYGLGMIVAELLGDPGDLSGQLKLFATDLNEDALQVARNGQYPDAAVSAVPARLRDRWMREDGNDWTVVPALRDCVVFARHNVALDPPFPKIHLVSLRNTLIYFEPALQERVFRLLHFSLVSGGLLLLGESERIVDSHELFETVDAKARIYRRRPTAAAGLLPMPQLRPTEIAAPLRPLAHGRRDADGELLRDALITRFTPPSLVIDATDEIIEVVGDVSRWCRVAQGRHSRHVVALVHEDLRPTVRSLVLAARRPGSARVERTVTLDGTELVVTAHRLDDVGRSSPAHAGRMIVSFVGPTPTTTPETGATAVGTTSSSAGTGPPDDDEVARMLRELAATEAALQATVEQLSTSNEELQALNEELQAAAEELQASNEEVRASNEELEATNEELSSLNAELQQRGNDLATANADLENIQASLTSGLVLVDRDLRVMRYTPLAVRLFALIESDIGRPLTVIPSTMEISDLEGCLRAAVHENQDGLLELRSDRADMLLHVHPYRAGDGSVRGAIVVCTDISEVATAHRVAQRRMRDLVAMTEALRETVWQRAEDGQLLFLNSQVEKLYGLSRRRVLEDPGLLLAAVHPQDRERVALAAAAVPDHPTELEYRVVRPDGELRWLHESMVPVPADDVGPGYTVSSALDVTDRHEGQQRAREQLATLEAVFDNQVFGVLVLDADDRVLRANEAFARMSGFDRSAIVGMPAQIITHEADPADATDGHDATIDARTTVGIAHRRLISRDGSPYFVTVETRPLHPDAAARRIVIVHDVTRLHEANDELARRARFDQQTGLLSRAHFRARLSTELARAGRAEAMVAVLWIDLDGFKQVNDRYGHQAGDAALREIAGRLQQLIRRHDAVGRLGGDEFAILITDVDHVEDLEPVTQRVLATLREPVHLRASQVHLSGSVGVAIGPVDGDDPDALLHSADTAMYAAKEAGSDRRVYFRGAMNHAAEERAGLRQDLAEALRTRGFVMHYQPMIEIRTGQVCAVEALIRWVRDDEVVPAAQFMELAEQTGQLRAIGALAVDLVDEDLHVLRRDLGPLPVCVNLSPAQLEERDMLDRLLAWDPPGGFEGIVIEVTEAAALARGGRAVETLTLLGRLGVRLSIDDFGTGYSNLALLDRLRPGIIKIDRTLLVGAVDEPRGEAVLRAAVQLAHALEADVVIEGVENERLWTLAKALPAQQAQGFHLARPMPLAGLVEWVRSRS